MTQTKTPTPPIVAVVEAFTDRFGRFPRMATEPNLVRHYLLALAS